MKPIHLDFASNLIFKFYFLFSWCRLATTWDNHNLTNTSQTWMTRHHLWRQNDIWTCYTLKMAEVSCFTFNTTYKVHLFIHLYSLQSLYTKHVYGFYQVLYIGFYTNVHIFVAIFRLSWWVNGGWSLCKCPVSSPSNACKRPSLLCSHFGQIIVNFETIIKNMKLVVHFIWNIFLTRIIIVYVNKSLHFFIYE